MSSPVFGSQLLRRFQRWGMKKARRSRFFPVTIPDKLGDDDQLEGKAIPHRVMVYFPDTQESLYQLLPWLPAFEALNEELRVVVVCQDSRTAAKIHAASSLDVLTIARYGRLDDVLSRSNVGLALYVNHSSRNFDCLRFTSMTHVYLGHGDSDKAVSASNQVKAYDYCFVAGQAAVDRIAAQVRHYDAEQRCIKIGQPQLDSSGILTLPKRSPGSTPTVLYAPTWEGAQPSVAYSSVLTHGEQLVQSLLDEGGFRVIYRPHPLTGVTSGEYAKADAQIRSLIEAAPVQKTGMHRVDTTDSLVDAFGDSDVLICDVSAVALNWLPTGRPLVVASPKKATAYSADLTFAALAPALEVSMASHAPKVIRAAISAWSGRTDMDEVVKRYFTIISPGAATSNFTAACQKAIA